ncbi:MAG: ATP-binding cassette domain-containing protein [Myxococcota bacterium]
MLEVRRLVKVFAQPKKKKKSSVAAAVDPRDRGRAFHALDGVSFDAPGGKITGLLGPNGAGKTTLLRVLSTSLQPSSGSAKVDGIDIAADPLLVRRRIGFLSGNTGLYGRLTPRELLRYFGSLHGMPAARLEARIEELAALLEMSMYLDRRCDALSTGMKQKVNIGRTLVHDPDVIVFDEPTTGLDVPAAETILALVERCREQGKTVILSTHHMHEVDRVCDHVVLIHQGKLRFSGSVAQMRSQSDCTALDQAFLALMHAEVVDAA